MNNRRRGWFKNGLTDALAYTPPLDVYGADVFGAWSPTRKLKSDYTGNAVRMTDSGNVNTYEIPFKPDGEVDIDYVVSLSISVGSRLRAILIYDQSGNGNNLSVSANGFYTESTPGVYAAYSINGRPVLRQATHSINLTSGVLTNNGVKSFFCVGARISTNTLARVFGTRNGGGTGWLYRISGSTHIYANIGGTSVSATQALSTDTQYISGFTYNSSNLARLYYNGSQLNSGTASGGTSNTVLNNIDTTGADFDWIQERIIWTSDKTSDASGIQGNMNDFYLTY